MKILDALKNKFSVNGSNIAEVIDKIPNDIPAIPDGTEDGAVPTYDATENKVDWQVPQGGGGDNRFIANASYSTETGKYFSFKECDKTVKQIMDAYKDGKDVVIFAEIEQLGAQGAVNNCVILRASRYIYFELDGSDPIETLNFDGAIEVNPLDYSTAVYQITVVGANISLSLIQLTSSQQSS